MNDEEREKFYKEVPTFMKHCPHLYMMQKQAAYHREMMAARQAAMQEGGHAHAHSPHAHGHGHAIPPQHMHMMENPETMKMMNDMANDPESKTMMEKLSERMNITMERVRTKISTWSSAEKQSFLDAAQQDPLIDQLNMCGTDVKKRLETFRGLSDEDLEKLMSIQLLMMMHMQQMASQTAPGAGGAVGGSNSSGGMLDGLTKMFSGLSTGTVHPDSTVGGHGHIHSSSCQHYQPTSSQPAPDVTSGKLDAMDR